jgi:chromosome segregation ATPase
MAAWWMPIYSRKLIISCTPFGCILRRQDNSSLSARVTELESAAKKHNSRIKDLETERDKLLGKVQVLTVQLDEARQALSVAQATAAQELQLLQQQHEEAAHAAQQQLSAATAKLEQQLQAAQAAAAAGNEQAAAAAAEREAALAAALADAQAAVSMQEAAAAESEQRRRRELVRAQDHIRQLETEKQVRKGQAVKTCGAVLVCCAGM